MYLIIILCKHNFFMYILYYIIMSSIKIIIIVWSRVWVNYRPSGAPFPELMNDMADGCFDLYRAMVCGTLYNIPLEQQTKLYNYNLFSQNLFRKWTWYGTSYNANVYIMNLVGDDMTKHYVVQTIMPMYKW